jgi:hypothetical protein
LTARSNLHLVPEPHIVRDILARHPDIVGDLVVLVALFRARQDTDASETMDRRMVDIVRFDIPLAAAPLKFSCQDVEIAESRNR